MDKADDTMYIASISYGKDSLAMLEAIRQLNYPLDRIITAQVWATKDIPADLPEMYEFKKKADKIIFERYGIKVDHLVAKNKNGDKLTYEEVFYRQRKPRGGGYTDLMGSQSSAGIGVQVCLNNPLYGFPCTISPWCNSKLKMAAVANFRKAPITRGEKIS